MMLQLLLFNIMIMVFNRRMDLLNIVYSESDVFLPHEQIMDQLASKDALDSIIYISEKGAKCSYRAIDNAAANGRLDIIKWLHQNRSEGCNHALVSATEHGQ